MKFVLALALICVSAVPAFAWPRQRVIRQKVVVQQVVAQPVQFVQPVYAAPLQIIHSQQFSQPGCAAFFAK